jgi:hypothetical protein
MSRTNRNSGSTSPVRKYVSFSGSRGKIKFYDKEHPEADEKGHVYLDSLDIVALDIKASISGFNENESCGINSNLLNPYDVGKLEFDVKTKTAGKFGTFAKGIYKEIKERLSTINAKYTTNVFALADFGDGYEIIKLELNGSSLSPWIELVDKLENDDEIYDKIITIKKGQLLTRKAGKTVAVSDAEYKKVLAAIKKDPMYSRPVWFYAPEITVADISEELVELAVEQDKTLQKYFDAAGVSNGDKEEATEESATATSPEPAEGTDDNDDLPF